MANPLAAWLNLAVDTVGMTFTEESERSALDENYRQLTRAALREESLATGALRQGTFLGGLKRMQGTATIAQQKVAYEASGVDSTKGTAAQVAASTRLVSELDAQTLENNAVREALGHTEAATQYRDKFKALQREAAGRRTARLMGWTGKALSFVGASAGGDGGQS